MLFSVAMTFSSFSHFRTSRTRSDLNLALKFLLVRDMFLNPPYWCSKHIRFIKNRLKKCLILRSHYNAGRVTTEITRLHAETEFEKYCVIQDRLFMSDFDKYMLELEEKQRNKALFPRRCRK